MSLLRLWRKEVRPGRIELHVVIDLIEAKDYAKFGDLDRPVAAERLPVPLALPRITPEDRNAGSLRDWLKQEGVTHAGMESTGVYWLPVYEVLEEHFH